jgi:hypothetical protein
VKHAGNETLAAIEPLLRQLRRRTALVERSPGAFYVKGKAFLHFHEDPAGTFADVKLDLEEFTRLRSTTQREQAALVAAIDRCLAAAETRPPRAGGAGRSSPSTRART